MAKKYQAKESLAKESKQAQAHAAKQKFTFNVSTIASLAACLLYFAVHFIPDFDVYDALGPLWLYVVVFERLVIIYLVARMYEYEIVTDCRF